MLSFSRNLHLPTRYFSWLKNSSKGCASGRWNSQNLNLLNTILFSPLNSALNLCSTCLYFFLSSSLSHENWLKQATASVPIAVNNIAIFCLSSFLQLFGCEVQFKQLLPVLPFAGHISIETQVTKRLQIIHIFLLTS